MPLAEPPKGRRRTLKDDSRNAPLELYDPSEQNRLSNSQIESNVHRILGNPYRGSIGTSETEVLCHFGKVGNYHRSFFEVEKDHMVKFEYVVNGLMARFPNEKLEVLDEGCGLSEFGQELADRTGVHVTKTDLVSSRGSSVSVHDLHSRFGEGRFQLVVSTRGGVDWGGDPLHGVANIYSVLKVGGQAYITVTCNANRLRKKIREELGIDCMGTHQRISFEK